VSPSPKVSNAYVDSDRLGAPPLAFDAIVLSSAAPVVELPPVVSCLFPSAVSPLSLSFTVIVVLPFAVFFVGDRSSCDPFAMFDIAPSSVSQCHG
jgi:hypothetical protein